MCTLKAASFDRGAGRSDSPVRILIIQRLIKQGRPQDRKTAAGHEARTLQNHASPRPASFSITIHAFTDIRIRDVAMQTTALRHGARAGTTRRASETCNLRSTRRYSSVVVSAETG